MIPALLGSILLLAGPAVLPVLAAVGADPVALLLLLPAGGLLSSAAAVLLVAFGGRLTAWYVTVALVANLAAVVVLARWRPLRVARTGYLTVLAVTVASCFPLMALRSARFGWDARSIWWLHARLFTAPGAYAAALTNPAYGFSHITYPPLLPASVGLAWMAYGADSYRLAQLLGTVLNASAVALLGWAVLQVARGRVATRVALPVGVLFVLGAFGIAGEAASNGYADTFTAATAAAAVIAGLVLPRGRTVLAVAMTCAWCAGSTKNEGLLNAALILLLVSLRYLRGRSGRAWLLLPLSVAPLAAWELAVGARGGRITEVSSAGVVRQSLGYRLHLTAVALTGQLWILLLAAVVSVALLHRTADPRPAIRSRRWRWSALAFSVLVLLVTYVTGSLEIRFWLTTSVVRVSIYPRLLLLSELALCVLLAVAKGMKAQAPAKRSPG